LPHPYLFQALVDFSLRCVHPFHSGRSRCIGPLCRSVDDPYSLTEPLVPFGISQVATLSATPFEPV